MGDIINFFKKGKPKTGPSKDGPVVMPLSAKEKEAMLPLFDSQAKLVHARFLMSLAEMVHYLSPLQVACAISTAVVSALALLPEQERKVLKDVLNPVLKD